MISIKTFLLCLLSHQLVDAGWETFDFRNIPSTDTMISAGIGQYGEEAYVGCITHVGPIYGSQTAPGELVIEGSHKGLHFAYDIKDYVVQNGIKYYEREDDCFYRWIPSSEGAPVYDAIQNWSDSFTFYVGRYFAYNSWHVGKVALEYGTLHYVLAGKAMKSDRYEVLTCTRIPKDFCE